MTRSDTLSYVKVRGPNALWLGIACYLAVLAIWQGSFYLYAAYTPGKQLGPGTIPGLELFLPSKIAVYIHGSILLVLGIVLLFQLRQDYDKWLRRTLYAYVVFSVITGALFVGSFWVNGHIVWGLPVWWVGSAFLASIMILHHPPYGVKIRMQALKDERRRISEVIARTE